MNLKLRKVLETVLLLVMFLAVSSMSFIYVHWTAYLIAEHHIDYEQVVPPVMVCLGAVAVMVFP